MTERQRFEIPIGDWSEDGHGKCRTFHATALGNIEAVREAYFEAEKIVPKDFNPEYICGDYGVYGIDSEFGEEVESFYKDFEGFSDCNFIMPEEMAKLVVAFINIGNPDLEVRLEMVQRPPMLPFYGYDKQRRHISCHGYGLFE